MKTKSRLLLTVTSLLLLPACNGDERAVELSEFIGLATIEPQGPHPTMRGDGQVLDVEVTLPPQRHPCPVFDLEVTVNGRAPSQVIAGGYLGAYSSPSEGSGCLDAIDIEVPWERDFHDRVDVRISDPSAALHALYRTGPPPRITLAPQEVSMGDTVQAVLEPAPRSEGAHASVRLTGPDGGRLELGSFEVVGDTVAFEMPEVPLGDVVVRVGLEEWASAVETCDGFAACEGPVGFMGVYFGAESIVRVR